MDVGNTKGGLFVKDGFVYSAFCLPDLKLCDTEANADAIIEKINTLTEKKAALAVFPELTVTGYTAGDLFGQRTLIDGATAALDRIVKSTHGSHALIFVGAPIVAGGKLYSAAVAISNGKVLGVVPKTYLPNYSEFYEARNFTPAPDGVGTVKLLGFEVPFGTDIIFEAEDMPEFSVAAEICEDLWVPCPPSTRHALAGAKIIVNLSASDELVGKAEYREDLIKNQSARLIAGYVYASAGSGESTTDVVYSAHSMICENGRMLAESAPFEYEDKYAVIDVYRLADERMRRNTFDAEYADGYVKVKFEAERADAPTPVLPRLPFVPDDGGEVEKRAESILNIQSHGLARRLKAAHAKCAVVGVSGGLDSTLALIVAARAAKLCKMKASDVIAVTMPCFGTTKRTKSNAVALSEKLGATVRTVDITKAVRLHFADIGQDENTHDVTYENAQARERTQVLMDIANKEGGIVVGTGDLSELALGWSTYNGDHMSMYGVNASVPKTLVRYIVKYAADTSDKSTAKVLYDILDTPVSPELLPAENGEISQKTEDIVGPYELHDFFLYYTIRHGFAPAKIYRIALAAFDGAYDGETIKKWLEKFYSRFFAQQFKRSCLPDGPKVGSVSLSPRGDWRMPSDAEAKLWLDQVKKL